MPKYKVTLGALRNEWNVMEVEAESPEAACEQATAGDNGEYEPGDLGTSFVEWIACDEEEVAVPAQFSEAALTGITYVPPAADQWAERDGFPLADWRHEVANDDTRLGYAAWCDAKGEAERLSAGQNEIDHVALVEGAGWEIRYLDDGHCPAGWWACKGLFDNETDLETGLFPTKEDAARVAYESFPAHFAKA